MSRKTNVVISSIQALVRQESEVTDTHHVSLHITKKVEVAIAVLPTTPSLRDVSLEVVSTGFLHIFEQKETKEDSPLYLALVSSCDLISSLLSRSPSGWCDSIFLWGVKLLIRVSAVNSPHFNSVDERLKYWMSKPLINSVVQFVSTGVEYRVSNEGDVIHCIFDAVQEHRTEMGWLLAHILAIKPVILVQKLFEYNSTLSSLVVTTIAQSLNLLVEGYPQVVQESLFKMVQSVADTSSGKKRVPSLKLLTQLMVQSPFVLQLAAKELLRVFSPQLIVDLMASAVESGLADTSRDDEDEGEIESGEENEDMDHDGVRELPLLESFSSIFLQLTGANAVASLNLIVGCVSLCLEKGGAEEEEEEDGEINPRAIAKGHLLKAIKSLMCDIVSILNKAVDSVLLGTPSPSSDPVPIKMAVSLQDGLRQWTTILAETSDDSLSEFLLQLVGCVATCCSEIVASQVLGLFLRKSINKLPLFLSLHEQYQLCHSRITACFITESISKLRDDDSSTTATSAADIDHWCKNVYQLMSSENICRSHIKDAFCSNLVPIMSLLPLTTPTSAITLLNCVPPLVEEFVARQPLCHSLKIIKSLLSYFFTTLRTFVKDAIENDLDINGSEGPLKEHLLCLSRSLISSFASNNQAIESFTCREIISGITSMNETGYSVSGNKLSSSLHYGTFNDGQKMPSSLLLINRQSKLPLVQGSLLNTRQTQHSGSLQKRLTPDPQSDSSTKLHSPQQMVGAHFNDHILCFLSEMTVNSSQQLAQVFMDKIAPCLVVPLGVWPENDSASSSSKHTIELHLNIKRNLDKSPILWKMLLLISTDPRGFMKCSSLVHSLLDTLIALWSRRRGAPSSIFMNDLTASETLLQSITQAGWIPRPLCYVSELFCNLTCEEVSQLHQLVYQYIKSNYGSILSGCQVPNELDSKTKSSLKNILVRNIDKLGHVYHRFMSSPVY